MIFRIRPLMLTLTALCCCSQVSANDALEQAIATLEALDSTTVSVEYEDVLLERVLEDLGNKIGIPIHSDWPGLDPLMVDDDDEITFSMARGKASTVLAALTLMMGDEFERPIFEYHAGRIILTSFQATASMRLTDAYDLRDLLQDHAVVDQLRNALPDPIEPPADQEVGEGEESGAETAAESEAGSGGADDDAPAAAEDEPASESPWPELPEFDASQNNVPATPGEELMALITEHVDPEAWINHGGSIALISERNGIAMISAPPTMHRKLREALARLRRLNPRGITIEAAIVDVPDSELDTLKRRHDPYSAGYARALLRLDESILLWRADTSTAIGESAEIQSRAGQAEVSLAITPHLEKETGRLSLVVNAGMTYGGDVRTVRTVAAIPHRNGAAILELPAASPVETVRLLVLLPSRTP